MASIATLLDRLATVLQQRRWPTLTYLAKGLSEETISGRLAALPIRLAREIQHLYQWRNGLMPDAPTGFQLFPGAVTLSLDEAIAEYKALREIDARSRMTDSKLAEPFWDERWFPLFTNRGIGGEYYVTLADPRPKMTAPILYYSTEELLPVTAYDDLTSLIQTITVAVEQGAYQLDDIGVVEADGRRLGRIFRQYNPETVTHLLRQATGGTDVEELVPTLLRGELPAYYFAYQAIMKTQDERSIELLLRQLQSDDRAARSLAAGILGELHAREAVPLLLARLSDHDSEMQEVVVSALGAIGDRRAVGELLALLARLEPERQKPVVLALGRLRDGRAVAPLTKLLSAGAREVQQAVFHALGDIGDESAIPILTSFLRAAIPTAVRVEAAWALGRIGGAAAEEILTAAAAGHPDDEVRETARAALERIRIHQRQDHAA